MHPAYKSDEKLCEWLRENSSGAYRLAGYAAERIEALGVHLSNVQLECDKLELERDEADRRAGAAERHLAQAQNSIEARVGWLRRAKRDAGYDDSISFDVVWNDALKALLEQRKTNDGK